MLLSSASGRAPKVGSSQTLDRTENSNIMHRKIEDEFDVGIWDPDLERWVYSTERRGEAWVKKEAGKQFSIGNHPGFWMQKDLQLNEAATFLWSSYVSDRHVPPIRGKPAVMWFPAPALMLAAMATECFLKAGLFCGVPLSQSPVAAKAIARGSHDLAALLSQVGWRSNAADRALMSSLSHYLRWAGRYPLPRSQEELVSSKLSARPQEEIWAGYELFRRKFGPRLARALQAWARNESELVGKD